jgi:hypothetical protein
VKDYIASFELNCTTPAAERRRLRIAVGLPYWNGTNFACPIAMEGMYERLPDMQSEDSFHALLLGIGLIQRLLYYAEEDGWRFEQESDGQTWPCSPMTLFPFDVRLERDREEDFFRAPEL